MKQLSLAHRHFALSVAALALAMGIAADSRAATVYAFSEQAISNLTITPTITPTTAVTTFAQDSTTLNGSGSSNSNPTDPAQAFQGGTPQSGPNNFLRYATGDPPTSPTVPPTFTRADGLIGSGGSASTVVSESYLNAVSANTATGAAGLGASFSFLGTGAALSIAYNYQNSIFVYTDTNLGSAAADYHFGITIKDAATNSVVNNFASANTNLSLSAPPPSGQINRNGTDTFTTSVLTAGTTYTITFSSTVQTAVTVLVPEPASVTLMGIGGVVVLGMHFRRRKAIA